MHFLGRLAHGRLGRILTILLMVVLVASWASLAMAADSEGAAGTPKNAFLWVLETSGWIGLIILICSIYLIATVARMFVELRIETAIPPELITQCEAMLEQRDFKGIFNAVKEDDSFFSRVLVTGITELPNGLSEAREAMERVGEMIQTDMERKISIMAVLGTVGPMIGLLGTLYGMIRAFGYIARSAGATIKADEVASRISESLVLTFEGVGLALVAIFAFSFFRNRILNIVVTTMTRSDEFLRHFAQAARAKPGAAAPAARTKV
jgi:biopolymer transport protein ExbB